MKSIQSKTAFCLLLSLLAFSAANVSAQSARARAPAARQPPVYVLVAGTWHGGWAWQQVSAKLRADGARVYTPSLSGLAEHQHRLDATINLDTHITDVVNLLVLEDLHEVVLIGHSYAGAVIAGVADRAPERLRHLVFLDALLLKNGQSVLSVQSSEAQAYLANASAPDQGLTLPTSTSQGFGLTAPADIAWVDARLTPHPYRTFTQPLVLKHAFGHGLPLTYIACTTPALPVMQQFAATVKTSKQWKYFELATGHEPMITMPSELAALLRIASK